MCAVLSGGRQRETRGEYLGALPGRTRGANEMINHEDCDLYATIRKRRVVQWWRFVAYGEGGGDNFDLRWRARARSIRAMVRLACDCT